MPVGVQVVANFGRDATALSRRKFVERRWSAVADRRSSSEKFFFFGSSVV
jgi:hypothetical protein